MDGDKHWSAVPYQAVPILSTGRDYIMPRRHLVRREDLPEQDEQTFASERVTCPCGVVGYPVVWPPTDEHFRKEHPVCRKCLDYTDKGCNGGHGLL